MGSSSHSCHIAIEDPEMLHDARARRPSAGNRIDLIGVPTRRIIMIAFVAAALTAALVGILVVGQVSQAKSDMFRGLTIDVVAAILVGGIAIQGGEGQLWRAGFGAIVLTMLGNIMLLLGIDAGVRDLLKGLLAAAVLLSMKLLKARNP